MKLIVIVFIHLLSFLRLNSRMKCLLMCRNMEDLSILIHCNFLEQNGKGY